jgi:hypothetical protein
VKTQLKNNKYLILKSYERGLDWHRMYQTDDLEKALGDYNRRRTNEPDSDFLLATTIESTIGNE